MKRPIHLRGALAVCLTALIAWFSAQFLLNGTTAANGQHVQPAAMPHADVRQEQPLELASASFASRLGARDARVALSDDAPPAGFFRAEVRLSSRSTNEAYPGRALLVADDVELQRWVVAPDGVWKGLLPDHTFTLAGVEDQTTTPTFRCEAKLSSAHPRLEVLVDPTTHWELQVVDFESGAPLRDVTLRTHTTDEEGAEHVTRFDDEIPGEGVVLVSEGVASPVEIEEDPSRGIYWVSAPGYLPRAVHRNRFQRRVRVELERFGELEVRVAASFLDQARALAAELGALSDFEGRASLVIESLSETAAPQPISIKQGGTHDFRLVPGEYSVTAILPAPALEPLEVFGRTIQVRDGDTTFLEIDSAALDPVEEAETTALTLVAILPDDLTRGDEWTAAVQVRPLGEESWQPVLQEGLSEWDRIAGMNAFSNTFQHVPLGQYRFRLAPNGSSIDFELAVAQSQAVEVVLDSSDLTAVDLEVTGAAEDSASLFAQVFYLEGGEVVGGQRVDVDPNSPRTRLWCPPTQLRIQVLGQDVATETVELFPLPGEATTVPLSLAESNLSLLLVSAWDGDSHAYADWKFWSELSAEPVGHTGRLLEKRYGQLGTNVAYGENLMAPDWSQTVLVLSSPGAYRIHAPWQEEPLSIDVPPGVSEHAFFVR